jgi:Tfp pilus assembly protein PilF
MNRRFTKPSRLLQVGDPAQASSVENELKKAIALDPKSVNAKLLLAAFYARKSRLQDAEQSLLDRRCHRS